MWKFSLGSSKNQTCHESDFFQSPKGTWVKKKVGFSYTPDLKWCPQTWTTIENGWRRIYIYVPENTIYVITSLKTYGKWIARSCLNFALLSCAHEVVYCNSVWFYLMPSGVHRIVTRVNEKLTIFYTCPLRVSKDLSTAWLFVTRLFLTRYILPKNFFLKRKGLKELSVG